jgi:hypothetical protein
MFPFIFKIAPKFTGCVKIINTAINHGVNDIKKLVPKKKFAKQRFAIQLSFVHNSF